MVSSPASSGRTFSNLGTMLLVVERRASLFSAKRALSFGKEVLHSDARVVRVADGDVVAVQLDGAFLRVR